MKELSYRQQQILQILKEHPESAISEIQKYLDIQVSGPTLNRDLADLLNRNLTERIGKGRNIRYRLSAGYRLFAPMDTQSYFEQETDSREGQTRFNDGIFQVLQHARLFTENELEQLHSLHKKFAQNIETISPTVYQKELERLTVDLSWKSSQIEGNTYTLLETEQLLLQKIEAPNRKREEAVMLLNHKEALKYIGSDSKELVEPLRISVIEDIHRILVKDLGVEKNIRSRLVGITGTTYSPPDNEFQIREYLQSMCELINTKEDNFEKAFLAVSLISYIQPFADGNKRTGRIVGNALLMAGGYCPLSYRSVSPLEYKKAVLLFYEQNNLRYFKELFIKQYEFAVTNYFAAGLP